MEAWTNSLVQKLCA